MNNIMFSKIFDELNSKQKEFYLKLYILQNDTDITENIFNYTYAISDIEQDEMEGLKVLRLISFDNGIYTINGYLENVLDIGFDF